MTTDSADRAEWLKQPEAGRHPTKRGSRDKQRFRVIHHFNPYKQLSEILEASVNRNGLRLGFLINTVTVVPSGRVASKKRIPQIRSNGEKAIVIDAHERINNKIPPSNHPVGSWRSPWIMNKGRTYGR